MGKMSETASLTQWANAEFEKQGIATLLNSGLLTRAREGLGGSHTVVTYPPLDALAPLTREELLAHIKPLNNLSLYLHIAFCEHLCPFCHYAKTYSPIGGESALMQLYLSALFAEINTWLGLLAGSEASSIYIGGGTPTVLSDARLEELLRSLSGLPKASHLITCVETSPLTSCADSGRRKLQTLLDAGVNRISVGIQSFDDALLRQTRGHGKELAVECLELLEKLGIEYNIDLLQDLPYQTDESIIHDLEWVQRFHPPQVTWYILRVHQESVWYRLYQRHDLELPLPLDSVRRRLMVREGMRRIGYVCRPGGRFVWDPRIYDRFKEIRGGTEPALLGMGAAAYSHAWGYLFRNSASASTQSGIRNYAEKIQRDGLAVESGLPVDRLELTAGRMVAGIRSGIGLPKPEPATETYLESASALLLQLERESFVSVDESGVWSLTERGFLFEEEICSLFYSGPVKERLTVSGAYWSGVPAAPRYLQRPNVHN